MATRHGSRRRVQRLQCCSAPDGEVSCRPNASTSSAFVHTGHRLAPNRTMAYKDRSGMAKPETGFKQDER